MSAFSDQFWSTISTMPWFCGTWMLVWLVVSKTKSVLQLCKYTSWQYTSSASFTTKPNTGSCSITKVSLATKIRRAISKGEISDIPIQR